MKIVRHGPGPASGNRQAAHHQELPPQSVTRLALPFQRHNKMDQRRGAVAVEFAIIAPILVAIVFGMIELGRAFEMKNLLEVAAREAARFASMDRDGLLGSGQTTNQKMIEDVKNMLAANGIDRDNIEVEIKDAENPELDFNLDDPANDLRLFEVRVSIDYANANLLPFGSGGNHALSANVVFRNGQSTISQ